MSRITAAIFLIAASPIGFLTVQPLDAVDEKSRAAERARQDFELMRLFAEAYEQIDANYVREVDRRELVNAAVRGMARHLDQHSTYIAPEEMRKFEQYLDQEFVGVGITVNATAGKLEIVSPLPGSPAYRAGLRSGDAIVEVDSKPTSGLTPADIAKMLVGPPGRPVIIGIRKPDSDVTEHVTINREVIQLPTVVGLERDENQNWKFMLNEQARLGYVRITHFSRNTVQEFRTALESLIGQNMVGLVLDLRSNPGGLMESSIEIADMFLDSGAIVSMKGRAVAEKKWRAKRGNTLTTVPMVVLINRMSASASEVLSACLQDNQRATIVGERSWGKGSVQNVVPMEAGRSALKLTAASYFRPSGVNIHRFPESRKEDDWGVKPNEGHSVELTKDQWAEWTKVRESIDIHYGQSSEVDLTKFEDIQLKHAAAFLAEQLKATATAQGAETEPAK